MAVICGLVDSCDEEDPIWDAELKDTSLTMIHTMKANRISYWLDVHGMILVNILPYTNI